MHEDVELPPPAIDLGKELVDLLLLRDVAGADGNGLMVRQRRDQLEHVVLQAVVRPVERQVRALALERRRDPPRDAALIAHAHDERFLALEQTHRRASSQLSSLGVLGRVRDSIVLEHAGGPCVDQREIAVRRVSSLDRVAVLLDLRIGIRHLDAIVPPAFHMRLEEPAADKIQIVFTQRRERVRHSEIMGARVGGVTSSAPADLGRRRGEYGIDAPYVPLSMGVGSVVAFAVFFSGSALSIPVLAAIAPNLGLALAASVADYLYASRYGKFAAW